MVDLDDTDGVPANEARESDAVGAGPLDPEGLDGAERPRPGNEIRVAGTIRRRAVGRESGADQSIATATCTCLWVSTPTITLTVGLTNAMLFDMWLASFAG